MDDQPEQMPEEVENVETQGGVWGRRSKKEVIAVIAVALIAIVGVTAGLVALSMGNSDSSSNDHTPVQTHLFGPQHEPTTPISTPQAKLEVLRLRLDEFDLTRPFLAQITNAEALQGKDEDTTADPVVRAAAWLLHKDSHNQEYQLVRRFALALVYYANGGASWTDNTDWLSPKDHCDWKGVDCCGEGSMARLPLCYAKPYAAVAQLDLYQNNVVGEMHDGMVLFQDLQSLFLNNNQISGEINGAMLSELPDLIKLYLQHNQLVGSIPIINVKHKKLDTLYLQGNSVTGKFPTELCPSCKYCTDNLIYFGVDCPEIECGHACCNPKYNCYHTDKILK